MLRAIGGLRHPGALRLSRLRYPYHAAIASRESSSGRVQPNWIAASSSSSSPSSASPSSSTSSSEAPSTAWSDNLVFYLNGERVVIPSYDLEPTDSLLTWLRQERGLTGTKHVCGEGGCGACTVIMSTYDANKKTPEHRPITSCLVSLPFVANSSITTIEGLRSKSGSLHPIQRELVERHASQCGYCTPGIAMALCGRLYNNSKATALDMEQALDGSICRCTGYRPIVEVAQSFASGSPLHESVLEELDSANASFPAELCQEPRDINIHGITCSWHRPTTIERLLEVNKERGHLVAGSHSYEWEGSSQKRIQRLVSGFTDVGYHLHNDPEQATRTLSFVSTAGVSELRNITWHDRMDGRNGVWFGAGVTISKMGDAITERLHSDKRLQRGTAASNGLRTLRAQTRYFANSQVRTAGTIAGSLVNCSHVSDLIPIMVAMGATMHLVSVDQGGEKQSRFVPIGDFIRGNGNVDLRSDEVVLRVFVPYTRENEWVVGFKYGNKRRVDTISIMNSAIRVRLRDQIASGGGARYVIDEAAFVLGALGVPGLRAHAFESWLMGKEWTMDLLEQSRSELAHHVSSLVSGSRHPTQLARDHQAHLIHTSWLRSFAYVSKQINVSSAMLSSVLESLHQATASKKWLRRTFGNERDALHSSHQDHGFEVTDHAPTEVQHPREEAMFKPTPNLYASQQATGETRFTADYGLPQGGLWAALVRSQQAHARIESVCADDARALQGVVGFFGAADVPGSNVVNVIRADDEEVFASELVRYHGQPVGVVVAETKETAERAARMVRIKYDPLPVAMDVHNAREYYSTIPVYSYKSKGARSAVAEMEENEPPHLTPDRTILRGEPSEVIERCKGLPSHLGGVVEGRVDLRNGQYHMYLEPHNCLVMVPSGAAASGSGKVIVNSSTQSPSNVVDVVSRALGLSNKDVSCRVDHVGGGFGGKQTRASLIAAAAAVPAWALNRPVKLLLSREEDMEFCPGRSPLYATYTMAWERDETTQTGVKISAIECHMTLDGGSTQDYSVDVLETAMFVLDSAYRFPHDIRISGRCAKTNKGSYTATRGFGKPQAAAVVESMIDQVARSTGVDATLLRNDILFNEGDLTLTSTTVRDTVLRQCWDGVFKGSSAFEPCDEEQQSGSADGRLPHSGAGYMELRAHCDEFNKHPQHRFVKRGVAMCASKGNMGFLDSPDINRGLALLHVHKDGSVSVSHSGVEMGQGLNTRMRAVAADSLGLPPEKIRIDETSTFLVPNTPPTTMVSTDMSGNAIVQAADEILAGLEPIREELTRQNGKAPSWNDVVHEAYVRGVDLSATGSSGYPMLAYDWEKQCGDISYFFVWGAALSVVEVDLLTGNFRILRTNVVQDCGQRSINPALDVGQVEGGFAFGIGQYLLEDMTWDAVRDHALYTNNVGRYKLPTADDMPMEWNVRLLRYHEDVESGLKGTKGIGEACNQLALSSYFAIKDAVSAGRSAPANFSLHFPASPEHIRNAIGELH